MSLALNRVSVVAVFALASFAAQSASGDEMFRPRAYWLARGYQPVIRSVAGSSRKALAGLVSEVPSWPAHSLAWPVAFQDTEHSIGNSMLEFQSYGDGPYYHGGCDLRVAEGAAVRTPVAGRVEAGHYGYSNNPDGSSQKFWYAWPQSGDTTYFEVAVITDDGYRFEFHHMDETRVSPEVMAILKNPQGGRVAAGTVLGNTISWPDGVYHHTHYNILTSTGVQLNPEFYSPLLADHVAPQVSAVIASFKNGETQLFGAGTFAERPEFFAVAAVDHLDGDVYDHPPTYAGIRFDSGLSFVWDFRERLLGTNGKFPAIWSFFVESISSPDGTSYQTEGGYGEGVSVVRIPVPAGASGAFKIELADEAGNYTRFPGRIGN